MAEFAALPLFTDSWVADTSHMARAERGLYHDLLVLMWRSPDCRVPNDIEWIVRRLTVLENEVPTLKMIIAEFCQSSGNYLFQKRLKKEFEYVRAKSKKQSVRAKSRWGKEKGESHGNAAPHPSGNAPSPSPSPSPSSPPTPSEFDAVDAALRKVPGIGSHAVATDAVIAPIWQLVQQGYDLHRQIIPSITRQLANRKSAKNISRWSFFVDGIIDDSAKIDTSRRTNGHVIDDALWAKTLANGRKLKAWDVKNYGPMPHQPGCRVPTHMLKPDDGQGWTEWKAAS